LGFYKIVSYGTVFIFVVFEHRTVIASPDLVGVTKN